MENIYVSFIWLTGFCLIAISLLIVVFILFNMDSLLSKLYFKTFDKETIKSLLLFLAMIVFLFLILSKISKINCFDFKTNNYEYQSVVTYNKISIFIKNKENGYPFISNKGIEKEPHLERLVDVKCGFFETYNDCLDNFLKNEKKYFDYIKRDFK